MDGIYNNLSSFQYKKGAIRPTGTSRTSLRPKNISSMFPSIKKWKNSNTSAYRSKSPLSRNFFKKI